MIKLIYILLFSFLLLFNVYAEEKLSKEEIQRIVHEYIMENPEVILESVDNLRKKMEESKTESNNFLSEEFKNFANDEKIPSFGKKDAKVIIVEFLDYNCVYCKKSLDAIITLLESDLNIKVSFRDYPILSRSSRIAAKAVLASKNQNKYFEFHSALLNAKENLTEDKIYKMAENINIDLEKLKNDMKDSKIELIIQENETLARKLNIRGTPTFIINGKLYAGALELDKLKTLIEKALSES
tara:strand:- start:11599 stop:12321 length:723 start_codon:yes stop_codon:yes gene_type:complete